MISTISDNYDLLGSFRHTKQSTFDFSSCPVSGSFVLNEDVSKLKVAFKVLCFTSMLEKSEMLLSFGQCGDSGQSCQIEYSLSDC